MKKLYTFAAAIALFAGASPTAQAASIDVNALDGEVNSANVGDGSGSVSNTGKNGTILSGSFNLTLISPVFPFQLPTLAPGESIGSASLAFNMSRAGTPSFNADLYGIGFRAAGTPVSADYFTGTLDTTDATLIQNDIGTIANSTTSTRLSTSAAGSTALATYLNTQYTAGAGGNFVFLRFSPDYTSNPGTSTSGSIGYAISSQETGAATRAVLTLNIVPEPATIGTICMAGLLVALRRKRRAR